MLAAMVRLLAIMALYLICPAIAVAENRVELRGQWSIEAPALPAYKGIALIDAENRVTWDAPEDSGKPAKLHGYIASVEGPMAEMILTNRVTVGLLHCLIHSPDMMRCYFTFTHSDRISSSFILRRAGIGPLKLTPVLQ